jgi:hypothetical protein
VEGRERTLDAAFWRLVRLLDGKLRFRYEVPAVERFPENSGRGPIALIDKTQSAVLGLVWGTVPEAGFSSSSTFNDNLQESTNTE